VGAILYLALYCRPDITYTINKYARYISNPSKEYFIADNLYIYGYLDASFLDILEDRTSTLGYIYCVGINNPSSWTSSKQKVTVTKQKVVALSTREAKYIALTKASKEDIYLYNLYKDILQNLDSESVNKLAENPEFHKRVNHIDRQYHYYRQELYNNNIQIVYINTKFNIPDIITK
ncbi:hypothetical protein ACRALDRAFT_2063111, partial [Sodiomyces alcalophilus JCM 7366]|uniref:uncharacterized protein n=1 Tax=Sodiomyces alcalophilus JCM 7366 TaxID=591952 RepID=UPI0039B4B978